MRKYVFENATVYISEPSEEQKENIREATERFIQRLAKEGLLKDDRKRRNHRRASITNTYARKRDKEA